MPEHIISTKTYLAVCVALLVLTVATVGASLVELGPWNNVVALVIAAAKATLIILYFMHMRYSSGLPRLVLLAGLLWLGILIVGTMDDYVTRSWLGVPGK